MPLQRFPRRKFSLSPCWLLSKFTIGTPTAGTFNSRINGAIGTVPPMVRINTDGAPHMRSSARVTAIAWADSGSVRNASGGCFARVQPRQFGIPGALRVRGLAARDVVALLFDVRPHQLRHARRRRLFHQPDINGRGGVRRNDGAVIIAAVHAANVEAGILDRLLQALAHGVGFRHAEKLQQRRFIVRHGFQDFPLGRRERRNVAIKSGDGGAPRSSFIDAKSCARRIAGFGIQLP